MLNINKVVLLGHVGENPKLSKESTSSFAALSIATNESYQKNGEYHTVTDWHNVVFFDQLAELVKKHVKKGMRIYIEAKLKDKKWQDKDGNERSAIQIVANNIQFVDKKASETTENEAASAES